MSISRMPAGMALPSFDGDEDDNQNDLSSTLVGSGNYNIVGIRYYSGVAHPGEFVNLVREPHNMYDSNAIRVDNLHGEKIGHIKATEAKLIAPIMDSARMGVRIEGTIPYKGNAYTLPVVLEFYCASPSLDEARKVAANLERALKRDYAFRLAREFSGAAASAAAAAVPTVSVVTKKMDWNAQQAELDNMFDQQLKNQYKGLPKISMPDCLTGITLLDYQIKGVKWLVKRETNPSPAPFYKKVKEKQQQMYLCEITKCAQAQPPALIHGSILCDEMGLGKSIQTICLILLAPPDGVQYKAPVITAAAPTVDATNETAVAIPQVFGPKKRCTLIVAPVSVLGNWDAQISQYTQSGVLNVRLYHGPQRTQVLEEVSAGLVDVLLVSYHTLAADANNNGDSKPQSKKAKKETIFDIQFHRIVLDEAHTIRNSATSFFKCVAKIKADRKLALTGTPFVNRADDIYSLMAFLGVEPLSDKSVFARAITQPIKNGDEMGLTRLRATMGSICLRRSKANVGLKLVQKDVNIVSVHWLDDGNKRIYEALYGTLRVAMKAIFTSSDDSKAMANHSVIFEKILRLRQACCSASLVPKERQEIALKLWDDVNSKSNASTKLTADEAIKLLDKLKGALEEETVPECSICLSEFEASEMSILKACSHVFCKVCLEQVLAKSLSKACPLCRKGFSHGDIVDMKMAETATKNTNGETEDAMTFDTPPKICALLDSINKMKNDEKGVIFSQFTSHLDLIGEALTAAGHSFCRIDGSVQAKKRIEVINSFNSDNPDTPRFILCSLLASGTGINLTRGNYAFMMDIYWNEAAESQAMDRIHRINQTRKVTVNRFVMKDSIEEKIHLLQQKKSAQAKGVLAKLKGDEKRKALLGDVRTLFEIEEE